jgi:hypothetical protein
MWCGRMSSHGLVAFNYFCHEDPPVNFSNIIQQTIYKLIVRHHTTNNDLYIYKMYGIYYIFNIYKKIKMRCIKI